MGKSNDHEEHGENLDLERPIFACAARLGLNSHAKEYVEAIWLMLQQNQSDDYVVATGQSHSAREFLKAAFGYANSSG